MVTEGEVIIYQSRKRPLVGARDRIRGRGGCDMRGRSDVKGVGMKQVQSLSSAAQSHALCGTKQMTQGSQARAYVTAGCMGVLCHGTTVRLSQSVIATCPLVRRSSPILLHDVEFWAYVRGR